MATIHPFRRTTRANVAFEIRGHHLVIGAEHGEVWLDTFSARAIGEAIVEAADAIDAQRAAAQAAAQ